MENFNQLYSGPPNFIEPPNKVDLKYKYTRDIYMNRPIRQPTNPLNPLVYFNFSIDGEPLGRMVIELRDDLAPRAVKNFLMICNGKNDCGPNGASLHYMSRKIYRVKKGYGIESGDVVNDDGTSGWSMYGPYFDIEKTELKHEAGSLSMVYDSPNGFNSKFRITSVDLSETLDKNFIVIGHVLRGFGALKELEMLDSPNPWDPTYEYEESNSMPVNKEIIISDCGQLTASEKDWGYLENDELGDNKLPPYPEDWKLKFEQLEADYLCAALDAILEAALICLRNDLFRNARSKFRKAMRYHKLIYERLIWLETPEAAAELDLKDISHVAAKIMHSAALNEMHLGNETSSNYACDLALALNPLDAHALFRRARTKMRLQCYDSAVADFDKIHEILPERQDVWYHLKRAIDMRDGKYQELPYLCLYGPGCHDVWGGFQCCRRNCINKKKQQEQE